MLYTLNSIIIVVVTIVKREQNFLIVDIYIQHNYF